jgi:hypothetical protein
VPVARWQDAALPSAVRIRRPSAPYCDGRMPARPHFPHCCRQDAPSSSAVQLASTRFVAHSADGDRRGRSTMYESAWSKAERYRGEANKYGEMARQAEPGYLADVFRKIAMRYSSMADDLLEWQDRRGGPIDA